MGGLFRYGPGLRLALLAYATLLASGAAAAADSIVYKWLDAQGHIHYSDRPPEGNVKILAVETHYERARSGADRSAPATPRVTATATSSAPAPAPASASVQKAVAADVAKVANEQCKQAKERYDSYVRSRRVYKEGPDKERVYLSDVELEETRVNARREIDDACKGADQP